jgi:hypothetical protein
MPTDQQPEPETLARDVDREFFERELASFVPHRVFDAHCHLWSERGIGSRLEPTPIRLWAKDDRHCRTGCAPGQQQRPP